MKKLLALFFFGLFLTVTGFAQETAPPLLARNPTLSKTHIVFSFAGDLWIVARDGGEAVRLTSHPGTETDPVFSADGSTIAFTGEYDGNADVFVVPASGGVPTRLTSHPGPDRVVGWTPDGKVLFASNRKSESGRTGRLFTVSKDGGPADALPLPQATFGSFSADGSQLVYEPVPRAFAAWKRYRGGRASYLWVAKMADSSVTKIPRADSNDYNPMWVDGKIYFLSDRNGPMTLFAFDPASNKVTQVIQNAGLDIKTASAGPGAIVYEQFGSLNLFDLGSGKTSKLKITVSGDMTGVRPRFDKVGQAISNAAVSPTGARAVFEARGEILTVPAEKGSVRNLTETTGVAERDPAWSPDGKWIAYFSDASGEYELHLRNQTGMGEVKKIKLEPSFYYSPTWSPDSKKIAFSDKRLNFWVVDVEKGTAPVKFDSSRRGFGNGMSWSGDSRWIAYTKATKSWFSAAFVYSVEENKVTQVTDATSNMTLAAFDRNGKYLYVASSTDVGPGLFGFDMSSYSHRNDVTQNVYAIVLKKTDPSPTAPESDDEAVVEEKKPEEKKPEGDKPAEGEKKDGEKKPEGDKPAGGPPQGGPGGPGGPKKEAPKVTIDFDGIQQRIVPLPIPARNFVGIVPGKANSFYLLEFTPGAGFGGGATVHKYDVEKRKLDKILDGVSSFDVTANGEKAFFRQGPAWFIVPLGPPIKPGDGRLKTEEMEVAVDPRAEWKQMYNEVWRIERDFFYDPNHHGLNLAATAKKYEPYLAGLMHRADLNYLFNEMLGELTIGHLYVNGGDVPDVKRVPGGLLGADYAIENGRYRFAKIYNGENWNPQARAPLTQPGVNVQVGDYLIAVNGHEVKGSDDLDRFLESTAGKQVVLKVGPNADGSGSREVTVVPVANENSLRTLDWIEGNRRKVDQMSNGRLAYLWLPDTANGGYTNFNRYFFSQLDKEGAVVDERFNGGGSAADYIIDYLHKPVLSYWAVRDGDDFRTPFGAMAGPKVMLVNEYAGSGGDLMPWMFRRLKIGPLIGKRTWGGLVGIGGYPALMDGGTVTAPHFAFYSPEGKWEIENHGVDPDQEVDLDPKAWREGRDTQLEAGVKSVMDQLTKNPPPAPPKRPAYPNYHKGRN